ncbi:hypothetical protein SAMN05421747_101546 [Parapedobacter composti]|uniref:Entericidin EcnA/B family protein n=1 Tax=Parapedobacter composti TaxID=623281 RepID=A0A1I1ELA9_9SPHI|nr:hypothetical protein [Parapedobacter composti]SFB85770.1 hypothetical protein SAMN05421747_101546 [Parapedobacter composti]
MKNAFKFGFLGLALSVAVAACNSGTSNGENTADSLTNEIEADVNATTDSIDSIGDAAVDSLDSLAQDSL